MEALHEPVLPRTGRLDVNGLDLVLRQPPLHFLGNELRPVVAAQVLRRTVLLKRALDRGYDTRYRAHVVRLRADPAFQRSLRRYPAFAECWQGRTGITDEHNWNRHQERKPRACQARVIHFVLLSASPGCPFDARQNR
jgi:hypothetical protein